MLNEALAALAATAGTGVVTAMVTDGWVGAKHRIAHLLGRGNEEEEARALLQLEQAREQLLAGTGDQAEEIRQEQDAILRQRFAHLLSETPHLEGQVRELTAFLAEYSQPAEKIQVDATAYDQAQQPLQGQGIQINSWYASAGPSVSPPETILNTLVPPPTIMVGRSQAIDHILEACRAAQAEKQALPVVVMHGMGGVGKTAMARTLASRLKDQFPDARFEVDLFGFTPGEPPRQAGELLEELLGLAGFAAAEIPEHTAGKAGLWRAWLAGRRVLLIFDNARDATQVIPLLPGTGSAEHCLVLVSSRNRLEELDTTLRMRIDTLPTTDAVTLLTRLAGHSADQIGRAEELEELAQLCGLLPLALRPVGVLLTVLTAAQLIAAMREAKRPLLHVPDADRAAATAFTVSYEALSGELQATLRACAWHPGPDFETASISALRDQPLPIVAVQLAELLRRNMLAGLPHSRYAFHDLFADYTRLRADKTDDEKSITQARYRLYECLRGSAAAATATLLNHQKLETDGTKESFATPAEAHTWLTAAIDELDTAAHTALSYGWERASGLARLVALLLYLRDRSERCAALYAAMCDAAKRAGDQQGEANILKGLGDVAQARNDYGLAVQHYEQARNIHELIGNRLGQANALDGLADVARARNDYELAVQHYEQARNIHELIGNRLGQANALDGLGDVARARNDYQLATECYKRAEELFQLIGNRLGQANALQGLGDVAQARNDHGQAIECYRQAGEFFRVIGNRHGQAIIYLRIGKVAEAQGERDSARTAYQHANQLFVEIKITHRTDEAGKARDRLGYSEQE
ncbi:tetratricopeptide repeat protein [Actinomadura sp. B10D3]|uniref:tetratricopeptide repeat protein n=1 Tax=Actinomadura sp. B10D3 TaxID=3153557 RepID=UPI00325E03B2